MKKLLSALLAAAVIAGAAVIAPSSAEAAQIRVCQPAGAGKAPGPARWTAPGSRTVYNLDNDGCVLISPTDATDAAAGGLVQRGSLRTVVANALIAAGSVQLPGGTYIDRIIIQETSGAAVTGGLKFGSTSGGTEIVTAQACGIACLTLLAETAITARVFTAPTTVFIDAVTAWAGARVNVTIVYGFY